MRLLKLDAIPNQSFSVRVDNALYELVIKETRGVMAVKITRDGVVLQENTRITAGTPLLPYQYQEEGNFVMVTEDEEIPYYTSFGVTQHLYYVEAAEVEQFRGNS